MLIAFKWGKSLEQYKTFNWSLFNEPDTFCVDKEGQCVCWCWVRTNYGFYRTSGHWEPGECPGERGKHNEIRGWIYC